MHKNALDIRYDDNSELMQSLHLKTYQKNLYTPECVTDLSEEDEINLDT